MSCRCNQEDNTTYRLRHNRPPYCNLFPLKKCGGEWRLVGEKGEPSLWVNKNQKSSYWLWSPLPFEGNPKPGRLWWAGLVEAAEEMQCDTNRLKEEVLIDWIKQGGKGGWGGAGLVLWGHDTNVFHWQDGKALLPCHTHTRTCTHSHKSMHLFTGSTQSKQRGHFPMHTLENTYTNNWFKLEALSHRFLQSTAFPIVVWLKPKCAHDSPGLKENSKDFNLFQATVTQKYKSCLFPIITLKQFEEMCGNFKRKYFTCHGCNRGALYFI